MTGQEATRPVDQQQPPCLSRRSLLLAGAGLALGMTAGCRSADSPGGIGSLDATLAAAPPPLLAPPRPRLSALHVHASFSEGPGSMQAQLEQAERLGCEVLWWTEHDWRMAANGYLDQIPMDKSSAVPVTWRQDEKSSGEHRFVHDAPSGEDGSSTAVWLGVSGTEGERAEHRLFADSRGHLYRTSLHGQVWTVRVHPQHLEGGLLGLDVRTSWRPTGEGREQGFYWISYRFAQTNSSTVTKERQTHITLAAPVGEWSEFDLNPADDFATAWPDLDGRDASCVEVSVLADTPSGGSASGFFAGIAIRRLGAEGDTPLTTQRALMEQYSSDYPAVTQFQGLEVSEGNPHLCWYGGTAQLLSPQDASPSLAGEISAGGGIPSYAHPFGVEGQDADPAEQLSIVVPALERLLTSGIEDCGALEVGYRQRGGATLTAHESLWDALSARGIFLTGLGVNDDHVGRDWAALTNNFGSWLWASSTEESDLMTALRSGQVYFGDPTLFAGQMDILPAAGGHMGSVVVGSGPTSKIRLLADDLPVGSQLELLRLDMSPDAAPVDPDSAVTLSMPAEEFQRGAVTATAATASDCLVRTRVRADSGEVVALSNPVWFVRDANTYAVPEHRMV